MAPRVGCVVSEFGWQRLSWDVATAEVEWPRLEVVEHASILRLEQAHIDWQDLAGRHGMFAMPSTQPRTAEEPRMTRFSTNAFYACTTRLQR